MRGWGKFCMLCMNTSKLRTPTSAYRNMPPPSTPSISTKGPQPTFTDENNTLTPPHR